VNQELENLKMLLSVAPPHLTVGGRLAIISFHSLEDREVKYAFRALQKNNESPMQFRQVTKKPVMPTYEERMRNPRSRSAKLRVLERTA